MKRIFIVLVAMVFTSLFGAETLYRSEEHGAMRAVIDGRLVRFGHNVSSVFKDYSVKDGLVLTQGNRFWLIGGEGVIENKPWQTVSTIITGIVAEDGKLQELKQLKDCPYAIFAARGLVKDGFAYVLGGRNHRDFMRAKILDNGEFGEWEALPSYPASVFRGGIAFYKGCFYANGKSTWRPGSDKMYALKMSEDGKVARKWRRVDSPEGKAQGALDVCDGKLLYFDEISGNVFQSCQEGDGLQLEEWKVCGPMPTAPGSESVVVTPWPGKGWVIGGGYKPKASGKFNGFNDAFLLEVKVLQNGL